MEEIVVVPLVVKCVLVSRRACDVRQLRRRLTLAVTEATFLIDGKMKLVDGKLKLVGDLKLKLVLRGH